MSTTPIREAIRGVLERWRDDTSRSVFATRDFGTSADPIADLGALTDELVSAVESATGSDAAKVMRVEHALPVMPPVCGIICSHYQVGHQEIDRDSRRVEWPPTCTHPSREANFRVQRGTHRSDCPRIGETSR